MLSADAIKELEHQQYRIIGSHSAVKVCGWTKKMVKGEGGCYKLTFYGIMSNQCMQMSPSLSCANKCIFCWRGYKAPVSKEWVWNTDSPDMIVDGTICQHHKLLAGFGGNSKMVKPIFDASKTVKHVAMSLTGEPITYPRINEMVMEFNKKGISTFMVTNAQYPDQIRDLAPVTQLYISMDAPNKKLLKQVDLPEFDDYWERFLACLDHMAKKKGRKTIRLTLMKRMNMIEPENYAALIMRSDADFIEVKAYMFVGASRQRLTMDFMPYHEEVVAFTKLLEQHLPDFEIVSEHKQSRVVMLARKKFKIDGIWHTWIDFKKWDEFMKQGHDPEPLEFVRPTPKTGLEASREEVDFVDLKGDMSEKI